MPRVARHGPYRFFFYSNEGDEPPHIHVARDNHSAKYWLLPVALAQNDGFKDHELTRIGAVIKVHRRRFLEVWHAFFER